MLHIESDHSEFRSRYEELEEEIENTDLLEDDNYEQLREEVKDFWEKVDNRKHSLWSDRRRSGDEEIKQKHKKFRELSGKARRLRFKLSEKRSIQIENRIEQLNNTIGAF